MKDKGKQMLKQNLEEFPHLNPLVAKPGADNDESKHPLLKAVTESTQFYFVRLPNRDCLN